MTRTYRVAGMTCDGWVHAVAKAVERRVAGAQIGIDLAIGLMQVAGAPVDAEIAAAVETVGFEFKGAV